MEISPDNDEIFIPDKEDQFKRLLENLLDQNLSKDQVYVIIKIN